VGLKLTTDKQNKTLLDIINDEDNFKLRRVNGVRLWLQHHFNPLHFVYRPMYDYFMQGEYNYLTRGGFPMDQMTPQRKQRMKRRSMKRALDYARKYEKYFYEPISKIVCPYQK